MVNKNEKMSLKNAWLWVRAKPLLWDAITTTGWSSLGKGVGFLIPFFIAAWFGVSFETDAFFFAYGMILFLSHISSLVVERLIVPYIVETRARSEDVGKFVGGLLSISGIFLLVLSVLVLLVSKPVLSIITRFELDTLNLAYRLLIEISPLILLLVWSGILSGALNAYKKFSIPALSPAFRAIVNLSVIFIFKDKLGVHAIAMGYVAGEIIRIAILQGIIKRLNLFKLTFSLRVTPRLRDFFQTYSYHAVGMLAVGISPLADRVMASWLGEGSVSVLHYAEWLYMIPVTFIATGLTVTILSHWSNRYHESGRQRLNEDVKKTAKVVGFLSLFIMLFLVFFYRPIVMLVFGRGVFPQARLSEVGLVWLCYLLGFVPYMISQIFASAFLTLKNTVVLMKCSLYASLLNILFNYILMGPFKVAGIALATSIVSGLKLIFLIRAFRKTEAAA